jgi:tight adherence protein C
MDPVKLQSLITIVAFVLLSAAALGTAWTVTAELRMAGKRKSRLVEGGPSGHGDDLRRRRPNPFVGELAGAAKRLGEKSAVKDPMQFSILRMKLIQAGYFNREAVAVYLGVKAAATLAAIVGVAITLPFLLSQGNKTIAAGAACLIGICALMGPDQILKARRSRREREYLEGFPDLLDLLVASVEAGLSLEAAVSRVNEELDRRYPNLTEHLKLLTLELRAGKARKDAWAGFGDRLGIDDAKAFATMLRQSEEMGTSLGETLSAFANDMRAKRMLRAEEKALALPAKLTLPLIIFIFPCLLGVLILPAAVKVMRTLGTD